MSLQVRVMSKGLEVYIRGMFSPKKLQQCITPNILIKKRYMPFYMHFFFDMSHDEVGLLRLIYDNVTVVDATNKHSIKEEMVKSLQIILLITTIFDISLIVFWI